MYLNDINIRPRLIEFLNSKALKPRRILEELHVHRGNAIADVVTVHSEAHCYEIKGDKDKIERLARQGEYYNKVFRKISLVTTERKLQEAIKKSPIFWGIIVAYDSQGQVKFRHVRKTSSNPYFDKELALATLWKSELTNLNDEFKLAIPSKKNKRDFATELSDKMNKIQINRSIANLLATRTA
ncbi:sce7726 family protein [Pseudoalteromonas sp. SR43-6]|uniref:sce7726 family protein n=1 Tax=unclassified Pseudoalteromonas TaxID=194690 RepID=UPI0015F7C117|nr:MULTISPECIES: sce7726 family protein [unclassified Pseudoalteromonas]MBB1288596.1 sce7726 family protein [Pseudoalteromonas sp. SR41-5]MBB1374006.1 sce7726 family protein [Pseudoalteromonas sp. SR43-6]MBB1413057.1 sce7726 family protein [Pseudoalteromonas sp. SG43-8]